MTTAHIGLLRKAAPLPSSKLDFGEDFASAFPSNLRVTQLHRNVGRDAVCRIGSPKFSCDRGKFGAGWRRMVNGGGAMWTIVSARAAAATAAAGSAGLLAKEMERVAAKEALLLCIKDAGGMKGLSERAANDKAKIIVNEKLLALERLNPTPRPTTSPNLEGLWQFEWAGAGNPGFDAALALLGSIPPAVISIDSLTILILGGITKATGMLKIFSLVDTSFTLVTKLVVEGPMRLKEEYAEGLLSPPIVRDVNIPSQAKGAVDQVGAIVARLPEPLKGIINGGIKLPLTGTFSRELIISYLDEEIMVARDKSGVPDVLVRLAVPATDITTIR